MMIIMLGMLLFSLESHAVLRCQGKFIDSSYSKLDVKKYCGDPVMVDSYTKAEKILTDKEELEVGCKNVDQWYYSKGPNETTYVIEFEDGFVVRVSQGKDKP